VVTMIVRMFSSLRRDEAGVLGALRVRADRCAEGVKLMGEERDDLAVPPGVGSRLDELGDATGVLARRSRGRSRQGSEEGQHGQR
jgi:hypothetical protein